MILSTKTLSLCIQLEAAKTTNDVQFSGNYKDKTQNKLEYPAVFKGVSNGVTLTTMVPAPLDNISRRIRYFFIYNADTVTQAVNIILYDGVTSYVVRRVSLTAKGQFQYNSEIGFAA